MLNNEFTRKTFTEVKDKEKNWNILSLSIHVSQGYKQRIRPREQIAQRESANNSPLS